MSGWLALALAAACGWLLHVARSRVRLSRAKHPSLQGHVRLAQFVASRMPFYEFDEDDFFTCDGAPEEVASTRRASFVRLAASLQQTGSRTADATRSAMPALPDLEFTTRYRVPFQFTGYIDRHFPPAAFAASASGTTVTDLDGTRRYDLAGSYGLNVFAYDFYKACIDAGADLVRELGPVLGPYHPLVADNVRRLCAISGLDAVSFHMSGTEAVMQAVRLARYHTRRSHLVRFAGAYHGWWDGVQPGIGNPRAVRDVYTLREIDDATLRVLRTRRDIACVLVNPIQVLHPNAGAPGDGTLVAGADRPAVDIDRYAAWLRELRAVCSDRSIVLIFDEVFVGFRLAYGGAQEYFGVRADLVTYGKTLGGGLPVGVVCGRRDLMRRFRPDRPSDICFARGTFNTHPYVMGAMHEFLRRLDEPLPGGTTPLKDSYAGANADWTARFAALNARLAAENLPVRVAHLASIATVSYTSASRYNWLFQFYLRASGLALSWVGSGRLIFSHDYTDRDFEEVADRFVAAARAMSEAGWWWRAAETTNRSVRRQIVGEVLRAWLPRRLAGRVTRSAPA